MKRDPWGSLNPFKTKYVAEVIANVDDCKYEECNEDRCPDTVECGICKKPFVIHGNRRLYCSKECTLEGRRIKSRDWYRKKALKK